MTEVEINGLTVVDLDITATKAALSSSSTTRRLASLQNIEQRLSNDGRSTLESCTPEAHANNK
jgi:hypothetical protein